MAKHYLYGVICCNELQPCAADNENIVELSKKEYLHQLDQPNKTWRCPICRSEAVWDDDSFTGETGQ